MRDKSDQQCSQAASQSEAPLHACLVVCSYRLPLHLAVVHNRAYRSQRLSGQVWSVQNVQLMQPLVMAAKVDHT